MSIIKKLFGGLFFSESAPKEVDLLDLAQQNLDKVKAEANALREVEAKKKAEELKLLERAAKLASIDRELESTYGSMAAGHKRVKKIEKRILAQKQEEQEQLQAHFDKARELRAKFEASLFEDDEEKEEYQAPSARRWRTEAPQSYEALLPLSTPVPRVVLETPPVVESEAPEEPGERPVTGQHVITSRGII